MENLDLLVNELRKLPNETQWVEFKHNNYDPHMIGADIAGEGEILGLAVFDGIAACRTRQARR